MASPLRGLLVEDDIVNQVMATAMLEALALEVDVAENGLAAVHAVQQRQYTVILMDCQMPELDGHGATQVIRQHEATVRQDATHWRPGTPHIIIGLTANAMPGDRAKCLAAGMDDYLAKPCSYEQLIETLQRCLPLPPVPSMTVSP